MANPRNNFGNFFDNPRPAMEKFRPSPLKVVEALMVLTSQDHEWYKDKTKRMILLSTMAALADDIKEAHAKNLSRQELAELLPVHAAAFLMVLGDLAAATLEYASQEEIVKFHGDDQDEDFED
jgi:hypothetical protein